MNGMSRRYHLAVAALGLYVATGVGVATTVAQQMPPRASGTPPAPSKAPPIIQPDKQPVLPPTPTRIPGETEAQYRDRLLNAHGRRYDPAQETRGKPITIAGRRVQLPPDAYVDTIIMSVFACPAGQSCMEPPILQLARGRSWIYVSAESGQIDWKTASIAKGEERAFDFLREALR